MGVGCSPYYTSCFLLLKDPPGPPKNLHHVDVDKTEISLVWNRPDRDGGAEINGYLVEYQEEGAEEWIKFKTVPMLECVVTGLQQGKTYKFRVKAQNIAGLSLPDTTIPIECQEKLGTFLICMISFISYF